MLLLLDGWFVRVLAACVPQILVLLDVNPEESMLDEGLAREVVNRIQKLRKKVVAFMCNIFGSRPSDHYFRSVCLSVCLFVCLFVQSFSQPSLIRFRSN